MLSAFSRRLVARTQAKELAAVSERLRTRTTKLVKGSTKCAHSRFICTSDHTCLASLCVPADINIEHALSSSIPGGGLSNETNGIL